MNMAVPPMPREQEAIPLKLHFHEVDLAKLRAPFPPERVSWRVGPTNKEKTKGMALAYIDARDVQDRLDDVCGPGHWQCRYPHANGKTVCEIGIRFDSEWIWKADGAGDTDMEADKGALSAAFKRAAVRWGIGRYLYDVEAPWVEIETRGKSFAIIASELPKLRARLGAFVPPPNVGTPAGHDHKADDAEKLAIFMRRRNLEIPVPGQKAKKPDYEAWARSFTRAISACDRLQTLDKLWQDNGLSLVELQKREPDIYRAVDRACDSMRTQLSPGAAGAPK